MPSSVDPWNLLHDGTIVRLERDLADTVHVWIDCPYVRARLSADGALFRFDLAACTRFDYTPYDEPILVELAAIASSEPDLVEAKLADDVVEIYGSAGVLRVAYVDLAIYLDDDRGGRLLPLGELEAAVRDYWAAWREHWKT